jgi:hypothetical protein
MYVTFAETHESLDTGYIQACQLELTHRAVNFSALSKTRRTTTRYHSAMPFFTLDTSTPQARLLQVSFYTPPTTALPMSKESLQRL